MMDGTQDLQSLGINPKVVWVFSPRVLMISSLLTAWLTLGANSWSFHNFWETKNDQRITDLLLERPQAE